MHIVKSLLVCNIQYQSEYDTANCKDKVGHNTFRIGSYFNRKIINICNIIINLSFKYRGEWNIVDLIGLAVVLLLLALVAYILGARGIAGFTVEIARWIIIIFVILAIISFLYGRI